MFLDARLGNSPKWHFGRPKDLAMRFPESMRKCVVYCARTYKAGPEVRVSSCGTGFLVSVPNPVDPDLVTFFVVTAKHVAAELLKGDWLIRVNTTDGKSSDFHGTRDQRWWFHPTRPECVDVAVIPFPGVSDGVLDAASVPLSMFLDEKTIHEVNIGAGDEVHITGIFNQMTKHSRNLPIVRTGNVALIPEAGTVVAQATLGQGTEPVGIEGYLIEARSIGGLSGSPTFVRATGTIQSPSQNKVTGKMESREWSVPGPYYLLGLMHGHWEILSEKRNDPEPGTARRGDLGSVNMGIAIVVPARQIKEVLAHPELVEGMTRSGQAAVDSRTTSTPD
jgi:hypothetical protein